MLDLYQAANICQRFRQVAVSAFRRQQRYVGDICWVPAHFVRFLRIFSPTKVRIRTSTNGKVFGAIAEYCHNLEALDIRKRLTQPHQLAAVRSLLPTLKTLSVKQMDIWNGEDADVDWPLETLYICGDCRALDMEWAPRLKLPKLKKLIVSVQNLDDPAFLDFLATNGHIEQLMMSHGCMSASGWHSIAERVPNLKSLTCYKLGFHADVGGNSVAPSVGVFKCLEEAAIWDCSSTKLPLNLLSTSAVKDVDVLIRRRKEIHGLKRLVGVTRLTLRLVQRVVIADVLANANAISGLRELHLHVGTCATVTLDCIKRLVDESKTITKLCVSWYKVMDLESVPMLPAITALVAARPKLSVEMTVERELFKVGGCLGCVDIFWRVQAREIKTALFAFS